MQSDGRELTGRGQEQMAGARGPSPGQRGLTKKAALGRWEAPGGVRAAGTLQTVCSEGDHGAAQERTRGALAEDGRDLGQKTRARQRPVRRGAECVIRLKPLHHRLTASSAAGFPERHSKHASTSAAEGAREQHPLPELSGLSGSLRTPPALSLRRSASEDGKGLRTG